MGNTSVKKTIKQSIVDIQKTDNNLHNVTDPNNSLPSSLDQDADKRFRKILVEQVSSDWMRFAHIACLNEFYRIVEEIQSENNNNQLKLEIFLQRIKEINPLNFNEVIANCLYTLKKFDILSCEAFDENNETVQCILVENVSSDWKRFAHCTCLHDIDSIVEQIDHGYNNNQSKMTAFLNKLCEVDSLNCKKLIVNSLDVASRFDVLFKLAMVESSEAVMKLLLEDASSDWKRFATYACLYEVNCIIENIDQENNSDQMKMKALLEKLFDINPLQFNELIKSTLITMKKFSILSAFEEEGCLGKEKEEKEKLKENTNEEPVLVNGSMNNTSVKVDDEQSIVEPQESDNALLDITKPNTLPTSSLDHEDEVLHNSELLLELKMKLGKDWLNLGRFLKVNDNDLDAIDADYNDLEEKAYRVLRLWKRQQKLPTLNALAKAIYKINRADLIKVIEKFSNIPFETENPLKPSIKAIAEMRGTLKKFYQTTCGKIDQLEHNLISPSNVDLLNKFVELTVVDSNDAERDIVNIAEREMFLRRQSTYEPIEFYELFSKEVPLLLISGIAGIGKTCLLRKCLFDWANNTLWKNIDLVIYFECRKLNQYQSIASINELLNVFYKNVFKECGVCEDFSILFVIDGLDEFAYLDELINHNPLKPSNHSIVNVLADVLDFHKYKCVVAGRIGAILQYKNKMTECRDKLTIQIMGFNDEGINEYVERVGNAKEAIKNVLKSSHIAKAMASVPFYLSAMCTIIGSSILSDSYSFFTTTELYCCIFLYFLQKHINRNKEPVYKLMEKESSKQFILKVCKVAFHLFNDGKVVFSEKEIKAIVNDIDKVENDDLGFIEKVESQLGYQYQFVHLTLMEFCASIHAHINLSSKEVLSNKKLQSCLPMICGLRNENGGPFLRLLANLKVSKEESNSMLDKERNSLLHGVLVKHKKFMECYFEAQALITEDLKRAIDEQEWTKLYIYIHDGKTAHEVSHEKYFIEKFLDAGYKLSTLTVKKNDLSEDEKKLIILCSTKVRRVDLYYPVKIHEWTPKHKIECLQIFISKTFVSKNEFEGFVLPWVRHTEKELRLSLHDDTDFVDDIYKWLCCSNVKKLMVTHRRKKFRNIEELKKFCTVKNF